MPSKDLIIARAEPRHAELIAENLSVHAEKEFAGIDGVAALRGEIEGSILASVGIFKNEVAVVWGVRAASLFDHIGYLWLVSTKICDEHPFTFARHSKLVVDELMETFQCLHGLVEPKYKRNIRWLKFMGFEICHTQVINGERYHPFLRRA